MDQRKAVLETLKPRELQPRQELQFCGGQAVAVYGDCGCGFDGCCPFLLGCMQTA